METISLTSFFDAVARRQSKEDKGLESEICPICPTTSVCRSVDVYVCVRS